MPMRDLREGKKVNITFLQQLHWEHSHIISVDPPIHSMKSFFKEAIISYKAQLMILLRHIMLMFMMAFGVSGANGSLGHVQITLHVVLKPDTKDTKGSLLMIQQ